MSLYSLILFLPLISVSARLEQERVEITSTSIYEEERDDFTMAANIDLLSKHQHCTKVGYGIYFLRYLI